MAARDFLVKTFIFFIAPILVGVGAGVGVSEWLRSSAPLNYVETWQDENKFGHWVGPENAQLIVTEFTDFTCYFCARVDSVIEEFSRENPGRVARVVVSYPARYRPSSVFAATVAECAARQGRFDDMYKVLFERQDLIVFKDSEELASEVGLSDFDAFDTCISLPVDSFPKIIEGRHLAERMGVIATPTVWINGRWLNRRDLREMRSVATEVLRAEPARRVQ